MDDTKLKESFSRAKRDIEELRSQISSLSNQIEELKSFLQQTNQPTPTPAHSSLTPTHPLQSPTNQHIFPTDVPTHSNTPTDNLPLKDLKTPFLDFSSRNEGVPTDRQTDRQTNQHSFSPYESSNNPLPPSSLTRVAQVINSLDEIKQQLRQQFKHLTAQEMLVFSAIYQLEEEGIIVDYPLLAARLKLSESSIRDYVLKLTRKGIPLQKHKEDNKKVRLTISKDLKRIASLQTLLTLREL